jgi:hypothetical protein
VTFVCRRLYPRGEEILFTFPGAPDPSSEAFRSIAREKGLQSGEVVQIAPIVGARAGEILVQYENRTVLVP